MKVLAFLEQRNNELKLSAKEVLTTAKVLAGDSGQVCGVIVGQAVSGLTKAVEGFGADVIYCVEHQDLKLYNPIHYTNAVDQAIADFQPDAVLGIASPMGRDIFPRLAARHKAGLLTDLVDIDLGEGGLKGAHQPPGQKAGFAGGTKPMYAGKVLANVLYVGGGIKFATLRPNVFPAKASTGKAAAKILPAKIKSDARITTKEIRKGQSAKADLTEATRIISGGRAMGSAQAFKILHECGETIGATVGASRAAVDSGYASHDMQVGQTGKTVNPTLYIACGISGSIQHMAGMRTSKVIVAINTDAEAPIFTIADYGIVGDLFAAVPILTKALREMVH